MERGWLEERLAAGRSIESIAREAGKDASTVGYWTAKHGLTSAHAARHAARGGIPREVLEGLVAEGLSVQAIAEHTGRGATTVRHWLRRYGLRTQRAAELAAVPPADGTVQIRRCRRHGETEYIPTGAAGHYRCRRCRSEHVTRRRRRLKEILVAEAGGRCALCGYDRFAGALQFHHRDPMTKAFALSDQGVARSLAKARVEVRKCVLLCANCHAEVESDLASIPP